MQGLEVSSLSASTPRFPAAVFQSPQTDAPPLDRHLSRSASPEPRKGCFPRTAERIFSARDPGVLPPSNRSIWVVSRSKLIEVLKLGCGPQQVEHGGAGSDARQPPAEGGGLHRLPPGPHEGGCRGIYLSVSINIYIDLSVYIYIYLAYVCKYLSIL